MLIVFVGSVGLFAACSYITDFVVANESDQPIEVRYKIKSYAGPFSPPVTPSTMATSEIRTKGNQQWNPLTPAQYQLEEKTRTVVVQVLPHQALRVATMHHYGGHDDPQDAEDFPVEEITLVGTRGEIKLVGQQARITFVELSRALYTLTYK